MVSVTVSPPIDTDFPPSGTEEDDDGRTGDGRTPISGNGVVVLDAHCISRSNLLHFVDREHCGCSLVPTFDQNARYCLLSQVMERQRIGTTGQV